MTKFDEFYDNYGVYIAAIVIFVLTKIVGQIFGFEDMDTSIAVAAVFYVANKRHIERLTSAKEVK